MQDLKRRCITFRWQEPAFQELILLYTDETAQSENKNKSEMLPLQLKIYEKIPIPDLPVSAWAVIFGQLECLLIIVVNKNEKLGQKLLVILVQIPP